MISTIGAHWIRAALQVNPYSYVGRNPPNSFYSNESDYNKALLEECEKLGISLIAITDHWCADSAKGLINAAKERGITALPGFEANSREGVHVLVIFDADTKLSDLDAAIGACGVQPRCANGTPGNPFKEILEKMINLGALVIPAHVNVASSGMLTVRSGPPLVAMVNDPSLHAIAITPSQPDGIDQAAILGGKKPFDRRHPLAVIYADDIGRPEHLRGEGATSWFKVSTPCVESLKLAVRTPETRVALSNPIGDPRTLLRGISWTGGFLDGVTIPISSDLTALIGGRGTGKSTVIESLRYALDLTPIGTNATAEHKLVVDKVLRSGTIVRVEVEVASPKSRIFTIERVVPNPPVVKDSSGETTNQLPLDVAGLVEIFGQHELAELASNPGSVADMLQRFSGVNGTEPDHQDALDELARNRVHLSNAGKALLKVEEDLNEIPRLEEQVKHFKDTDLATRLEDLQRLARDEGVFEEAETRVSAAQDGLRVLSEAQHGETLKADYDALEDSPQRALLERVARATTALAANLEGLADQASVALTAAQTDLAASRLEWETAVSAQRDGHAEVLRKLHEEGLEPDKYLDKTKALDDLKAKEPRLAGHKQKLNDLLKARKTLLGELEAHERKQAEKLHDALRAANDATGGVVVVRPVPSPDRSAIEKVISGSIAGVRTQIMAAVAADDFSPRALSSAILSGRLELEKFGIKGAQATSLLSAGEPLARELEELTVAHAVEVLLDISPIEGVRELRTINELSKGQRATALLLLLLGASTAPLVIDQPEDDLDNRFVYEGVVVHLRKLKGVRQIIASTHNANVPVLGDAELIVALEGDGQHGRPVKDGIGSLDDVAVRALAENILEGGPAAFNARQHLYGF